MYRLAKNGYGKTRWYFETYMFTGATFRVLNRGWTETESRAHIFPTFGAAETRRKLEGCGGIVSHLVEV